MHRIRGPHYCAAAVSIRFRVSVEPFFSSRAPLEAVSYLLVESPGVATDEI